MRSPFRNLPAATNISRHDFGRRFHSAGFSTSRCSRTDREALCRVDDSAVAERASVSTNSDRKAFYRNPFPCHAEICAGGARRGAGAFTILEILLALAIIALIGSVLIGGSLHLLSEEPATLEQVFWKSVQDARKQALKAEHEMRLKYDAQKKQFVILDGLAPATLAADGITKEEVSIKRFPVPPASAKDLTIDLLSGTKSGAMVLIGGVLQESRPLLFVTFYPDGTCSPFRLQIAGSAGAYTLDVDPWTCAAILKPGESNTLGNP